MGKIIAIDLGTTKSMVAVMQSGRPVVIPTPEGTRSCPSVVAFAKGGDWLVGEAAKRQAVGNPENAIFSIKRLIGRRYDDAEIERVRSKLPYRVTPGTAGDAQVYIPATGRQYTSQEISAIMLRGLKADAEAYLGEPVTQAVISVPACFNNNQRQATREAGQIAGLEVLRIINEPTAAALAYGLDKKGDKTILVWDLGGGVFDVSILDVGEGVFEVKSTNGDTQLGGDDWNQCIVDWVAEEFHKGQGFDLRRDCQALERLKEAAEKAKIELSTMLETEINLPFIAADASGPRHLQTRLTRSKFEQLTRDLVNRCGASFKRALADAKLKPAQVDEVVLVGGATLMPMIRDLVRQLTSGKEPCRGVNPHEAVAIGAAIQAGVLGGEVKDVLLLDVAPLSLGVEILGGAMHVLIPCNTTIPTRNNEIFSTAEDGQIAVDIKVFQGEHPMAADNMLLGQFRLDGIPPAPRGIPQIEVSFDIDADGILNVSAIDKATGHKQKITMSPTTGLSQEEVARLRRRTDQEARTRDLGGRVVTAGTEPPKAKPVMPQRTQPKAQAKHLPEPGRIQGEIRESDPSKVASTTARAFREIKKETLRKRLANLIDAYEAANNQLDSTLSAVDRTRLKKQIKDLEQEISEVESELESLQ